MRRHSSASLDDCPFESGHAHMMQHNTSERNRYDHGLCPCCGFNKMLQGSALNIEGVSAYPQMIGEGVYICGDCNRAGHCDNSLSGRATQMMILDSLIGIQHDTNYYLEKAK